MGARVYDYPSTFPFVVDQNTLVRNYGRQIDWDQVTDDYRDDTVDHIVKLSAGAAADAVALAVDALPVRIPAGTNLYFGESKEFARVTVAAAVGATALTVEALPAALENDDEAIFRVIGVLPKRLEAGTIVAELASGKIIPRALSGATVAIGILESEAIYDPKHPVQTGQAVLIGGVVYGNLLPDALHADIATWKTELATAGTGFVYETYADNR